jgi:hypothetical protein
MYTGKGGAYGGNVEITASIDVRKLSISSYFLSEGHATQTWISIVKVVHERNANYFFSLVMKQTMAIMMSAEE